MRNNNHFERIDWFLPLRLTSYIIFFAVAVLWMGYPSFVHIPLIVYSIVTLSMAVALLKPVRTKYQSLTPWIVALHFVTEIAFESVIVNTTGDLNSPFMGMFVLTIVSAALVYRLTGTLLIATVVSGAFTFIVWVTHPGGTRSLFSLEGLSRIVTGQEQLFYSLSLYLLIFYLIAFVSGYLAERLKRSDSRLADTSRALRRAKLETDDILRHLSSGLMTIDARGLVMFFNRAAERILGYSESDVKGRSCEEVFETRMPDLAKCLLAGITERIEFPRKELQVCDAEGRIIPLGLSTSVLTEDSGDIRGVIAIFSDLTEAKELEGKVRMADRLAAVGELSACIAHEIRNPLAAISGSVEVLKGELQLAGENEQLMKLIVKESDRLTKMLAKFLQYTRIERTAFNKVELCHLISETIEILHHNEAMSPDIRINFETNESIVYVVGDEDLIKQILINLAVNACEAFEGKEGEITFRVDTNANEGIVLLYIEDNGPGISKDMLKKIYQPFYSTRKEGTGLGLAIVHRIADALGVELRVRSERNIGTTFVLEFKTFSQPGLPEPAIPVDQGIKSPL